MTDQHTPNTPDDLLSEDRSEIRLVDAPSRDVWTKPLGWRCEYEDGRGRCTSRKTRHFWHGHGPEYYCEKHWPGGSGV